MTLLLLNPEFLREVLLSLTAWQSHCEPCDICPQYAVAILYYPLCALDYRPIALRKGAGIFITYVSLHS